MVIGGDKLAWHFFKIPAVANISISLDTVKKAYGTR